MNAKRLGKWALVLGSLFGPLLIFGLVYWTWCWGYWGRGNLLLQALFQCRCPAASEQARYKPFKVVAPACAQPLLKSFSPSGRYVAISQSSPDRQVVRLDLETGQVLATGLEGGIVQFVSDDLWVVSLGRDKGYLLVDLTDGRQVSVSQTKGMDAILEKLNKVEKVIVTSAKPYPYPFVVGLARNYKNNPDENVVVFLEGKPQEFLDLLSEMGITYHILPPPYIKGPAPNYDFYSVKGQLYAEPEGIHVTQTEQLILATGQTPSMAPDWYGPEGWVLNERAVVYGAGGYRYVVDNSQSVIFPSLFPVPQPILLLEVPPQYWATPTPEP